MKKSIKEIIINANISQLNDIMIKHYNNFIYQNQILLMGIGYKNCFKRAFRKMNIRDCLMD